MPTTITVGTFNIENLFTRYKFRGKKVTKTAAGKKTVAFEPFTPAELSKAVERGFINDRNLFERILEPERKPDSISGVLSKTGTVVLPPRGINVDVTYCGFSPAQLGKQPDQIGVQMAGSHFLLELPDRVCFLSGRFVRTPRTQRVVDIHN